MSCDSHDIDKNSHDTIGIARLKLPPLTKAGTNISLMYAEALAHPGLASRDAPDAWNNGGGGKTPLCTCYLLHLSAMCLPEARRPRGPPGIRTHSSSTSAASISSSLLVAAAGSFAVGV